MNTRVPTRPTSSGGTGEDLERYLDLFASQVAVCARDSAGPVDSLAQCVLSIATSAQAILETVRGGQVPADSPARLAIERQCAAMLERVQLAVVAFQFHDLLAQRLQHVCEGLGELAATLRDSRLQGADQWRAVGERIRGRYSLSEQLTLFDQVVTGVTAEPASEPAGSRRRVELF